MFWFLIVLLFCFVCLFFVLFLENVTAKHNLYKTSLPTMYSLCRCSGTSLPCQSGFAGERIDAVWKGYRLTCDSHRMEKTVRVLVWILTSQEVKVRQPFTGVSRTSVGPVAMWVCMCVHACVYVCGWVILEGPPPGSVIEQLPLLLLSLSCFPAWHSLSRRVYPKPPQRLAEWSAEDLFTWNPPALNNTLIIVNILYPFLRPFVMLASQANIVNMYPIDWGLDAPLLSSPSLPVTTVWHKGPACTWQHSCVVLQDSGMLPSRFSPPPPALYPLAHT